MIRIDLGKKGEKKSAKNALSSLGLKLPENLKIPKVDLEVREYLLIGVVTAFAGLPHLFVMQYRGYVESQHTLTMKTLQEKEGALKSEIAKYQSYQREMESYEKQKKLIRERLEIVRRLLASRSTPVNILDAVGQSLPIRAWLSNIELKAMPEPAVSLAGHAYSNEDISDFIDKLSESIHLADVTLDSVSSVSLDKEVEAKSFQVTAVPKGIQMELPLNQNRATAASSGTVNGVNEQGQSTTVTNDQAPENN